MTPQKPAPNWHSRPAAQELLLRWHTLSQIPADQLTLGQEMEFRCLVHHLHEARIVVKQEFCAWAFVNVKQKGVYNCPKERAAIDAFDASMLTISDAIDGFVPMQVAA